MLLTLDDDADSPQIQHSLIALLLQIPNVIDADNFVCGIADRLVAGDVAFAENGCFTVIGLIVPNVDDDFAFGIEDRAQGPPIFATTSSTN